MKIKVDDIIAGFLALTTLSVIGVVFWSAGYGFEYSDESFYLLGFKYFSNTPDLHGAPFHRVLHTLFGWLEPSIYLLRILRLIFSLLAGIGLLYILRKEQLNRVHLSQNIILLCLILMGILVSYSQGPQALSYNSLSNIIIVGISALWYNALKSKNNSSKLIQAEITGGLFALLLFVKITNLLLFPVLVTGSILWYHACTESQISIMSLVWQLFIMASGSVLVLLLLSSESQSIISLVEETVSSVFSKTSNNSGHSLGDLSDKYRTNFEQVWSRISAVFLAIVGLFGLVKVKQQFLQTSLSKYLPNLFFGTSMALLLWLGYADQHWLAGTTRGYFIMDAYIVLWFIVYLHQFLIKNRADQKWLFGLLLLPVCGAIGTNNGLSSQFLYYGVFIFLGIWWMINKASSSWIKQFTFCYLIILSASQVFTGLIGDPYRQFDLRQSTETLDMHSGIGPIHVDSFTHELYRALTPYRTTSEEYVFAFSHQSGIVLLLDKKPFSLQWINSGNTVDLCNAAERNGIEAQNLMFAVPIEYPLCEEDKQCLKDNGIDFSDFELVDEIEYHDFVRKQTQHLEIYRHGNNNPPR